MNRACRSANVLEKGGADMKNRIRNLRGKTLGCICPFVKNHCSGHLLAKLAHQGDLPLIKVFDHGITVYRWRQNSSVQRQEVSSLQLLFFHRGAHRDEGKWTHLRHFYRVVIPSSLVVPTSYFEVASQKLFQSKQQRLDVNMILVST